MKKKEVKLRMKLILDDLKVIKSQFTEEQLSSATYFSEELNHIFSNIEIAADLKSDECLDWGMFHKTEKVVGILHPRVEEIINILRNEVEVDGETIEYIVKQVGLEEQLIKQHLCREEELSLKEFWRDVYNREHERRETVKRVWEDLLLDNGQTNSNNNFEDYYKKYQKIIGHENRR